MDKVYRLLDWLAIEQAVDWLQDLTETRVDKAVLLRLCAAGQCTVHLDCVALAGQSDDWLEKVISSEGKQRVTNPNELIHCGTHQVADLELFGFARVQEDIFTTDQSIVVKELAWSARAPMSDVAMIFKRADIEALAAKMNESSQIADKVQVESASHAVGQERIARILAEDQVLSLTDDLLHEKLSRESAERLAARFREELNSRSKQQPANDLQGKPLHARERESMSRIIAALAAMAGLDLSSPYKAAGILQYSAAANGLDLPTSKETLTKFLKDASESKPQ